MIDEPVIGEFLSFSRDSGQCVTGMRNPKSLLKAKGLSRGISDRAQTLMMCQKMQTHSNTGFLAATFLREMRCQFIDHN